MTTLVSSVIARKERLRRLLTVHVLVVAGAWLITRLFLAHELGLLGGVGKNYEDVGLYQHWASSMAATHSLPTGSSWQYPVGAAWLFLLAHLENSHYGAFFCVLMFACDLSVTVLLTAVATRNRSYWGSGSGSFWYWCWDRWR